MFKKKRLLHNISIASSTNNCPINNTGIFFAYKYTHFWNAHIETWKIGHCQATPPRLTCCHLYLHLVELPSAHTFQIWKKVPKPSVASTLVTCHRYNVNLCKTVQDFKAHYNTNVPEGTMALIESGTVQLGWLGSRAAQLISMNSYFCLVSSVDALGRASNVRWRLDFKLQV